MDRLAIVGTSGMGALTYRPVILMESNGDEMTLDIWYQRRDCLRHHIEFPILTMIFL